MNRLLLSTTADVTSPTFTDVDGETPKEPVMVTRVVIAAAKTRG